MERVEEKLMHFMVGPPHPTREVKARPKSGRFVVSRDYLKRQAGEAITLFLAPAAGVFNAVTGERVRIGRNERDLEKKRA